MAHSTCESVTVPPICTEKLSHLGFTALDHLEFHSTLSVDHLLKLSELEGEILQPDERHCSTSASPIWRRRHLRRFYIDLAGIGDLNICGHLLSMLYHPPSLGHVFDVSGNLTLFLICCRDQ